MAINIDNNSRDGCFSGGSNANEQNNTVNRLSQSLKRAAATTINNHPPSKLAPPKLSILGEGFKSPFSVRSIYNGIAGPFGKNSNLAGWPLGQCLRFFSFYLGRKMESRWPKTDRQKNSEETLWGLRRKDIESIIETLHDLQKNSSKSSC